MEWIRKFFNILKCQINFLTNQTYILPFLVLNITTDCNSRCLMCDYWKKQVPDRLSPAEIRKVAEASQKLNLKKIIISGGEALLHPDFEAIAGMLADTKIQLSLATNGILLEQYAPLVAKYFSTVFISLDASHAEVYKQIRGVDALLQVIAGVKKLKSLKPSITVIGRNVIQKSNYSELVSIIKTAQDMGMDHLSFSAADMACVAFGRNGKTTWQLSEGISLDKNDLSQFKTVISDLRNTHPEFFTSRFIIEGFRVFLHIYNYYKAISGQAEFPAIRCNLPWLYSVIEADGKVKPCYACHDIGNIRQEPFEKIVNSARLIEFRDNLKKHPGRVCNYCAYSDTKVTLKMLYGMF
ncbi:MAG TPA: radical SAM protein [Candidatus Omnitrophota bacterium]|nr:radical SAM protein [Candidatus Omnitrophota bacterium]HPT39201.1 radical SAM protein [Candidatus Omnitrophota bacterium]